MNEILINKGDGLCKIIHSKSCFRFEPIRQFFQIYIHKVYSMFWIYNFFFINFDNENLTSTIALVVWTLNPPFGYFYQFFVIKFIKNIKFRSVPLFINKSTEYKTRVGQHTFNVLSLCGVFVILLFRMVW